MQTKRRVLAGIVAPATAIVLAAIGAAPTASATPSQATAETCEDICVNGVRAATHTGYDRVVFDLGAGPLPTIETGYGTSPGYMTPGGEPREMLTRGSSYLSVSLKNAENGTYSATTPHVKLFNLPTVKANQLLYTTGSILGYSPEIAFGLTLDGPVSRYNVFTLTQPNRVVVDVYR